MRLSTVGWTFQKGYEFLKMAQKLIYIENGVLSVADDVSFLKKEFYEHLEELKIASMRHPIFASC